MKWLLRVGLVGVFAAIVTFAGAARADDAVAKAYFEKGMKLYNVGEYAKALDLFKSAYLEKPDAAFLFNIGQCQRQMSDFDGAEKSYRAYLREANPAADQRAAVQRLIESMEQAAKEARQKQPPTGVEPPATATQATPAPPQPQPAPSVVTAPHDDEIARARVERRAGIGLAVGGAVLVGLGGAFYAVAKSANDGAGSDGVYHPDAISRRNSFQGLEAASFTIGAAAIVTGTVLYIVGRRASSSHAQAVFGHSGVFAGIQF